MSEYYVTSVTYVTCLPINYSQKKITIRNLTLSNSSNHDLIIRKCNICVSMVISVLCTGRSVTMLPGFAQLAGKM